MDPNLDLFLEQLKRMLADPEQKAILEGLMDFVREGKTPEGREERLRIIEDFARKKISGN